MDEEERMKVFSIQSIYRDNEPNHADIILRLYWYMSKPTNKFTCVSFSKDKYIDDLAKSSSNEYFLQHFDFSKKSKNTRYSYLHQDKVSPEKTNSENKLLQNLRICDVEEFCDTIFLDRELVKNLDKLLELFDEISEKKIFCDIPELRYSLPASFLKGQENTKQRYPWFDFSEINSLASVILGFLEFSVIQKYSIDFHERYCKALRKDLLGEQLLVWPWKLGKEFPAMLKEYPQIYGDVNNLIDVVVDQVGEWLQEEQKGFLPKASSRFRQVFRIVNQISTRFQERLQKKEELAEELRSVFLGDQKERLTETVLCPHLDCFGDPVVFLVHSMNKDIITILSNYKIQKFHQNEIDESQKQKKKKKRKKQCREALPTIEADNTAEEGTSQVQAESQMSQNEKTISGRRIGSALEDPNESLDLLFKSDNFICVGQGENNNSMIQIEIMTAGALKGKNQKITKAEFKREKRKRNRKNKNMAAKMNQIEISSDSSLDEYSPLKKASCLSVAGSGILDGLDEMPANKRKKMLQNDTGIQMRKPSFFDEEQVEEVRDKCSSLTQHHSTMEDEEAQSEKYRSCELYKCPRMYHTKIMETVIKEFENRRMGGKTQKESDIKSLETRVEKRNSLLNSLKEVNSKINTNCQPENNRPKKPSSNVQNGEQPFQREKKHWGEKHHRGRAPRANHEGERRGERGTNSTSSFNSEQVPRARGAHLYSESRSIQQEQMSFTGDKPFVRHNLSKQPLIFYPIVRQGGEEIRPNFDRLAPPMMNWGMPIQESFAPNLFLRKEDTLLTDLLRKPIGSTKLPKELLENEVIMFLNEEIINFIRSIQRKTQGKEDVRTVARERIVQVARLTFTGCTALTVKRYGSWETGLMIPNSDIDLLISTPEVDNKDISIKMLDCLKDNLQSMPWVTFLKFIPSAQIPVLKVEIDAAINFNPKNFPLSSFTDEFLNSTNFLQTDMQRDTRIRIDIIVEDPEISAIQTTEYAKTCLMKYPPLLNLVLLLKFYLSVLDLANPYTGKRRLTKAVSAATQ
jgi:hypothetical protein